MAYITIDIKKLKHNYDYLDKLFSDNGIRWSVVTKILCGNRDYLTELLSFGVKQVCDSRITNLQTIKSINPEIETLFIKPPAKSTIPKVIKYADISVNTELDTIRLLAAEAKRQNVNHKIIIMIELGELREGVMRDNLIDFYAEIFNLNNIEVVGIGANLSCLYGILPNQDKLIQLSLYKQLIEAKFNKKIALVSGGSSVTIPLLIQGILPKGINHFRVGETLFLGTDVYNSTPLDPLNTEVFKLFGNIIELIEKPVVPTGELSTNVSGHSFEFDQEKIADTTHRAIVDIGLLDVGDEHISPVNEELKIVGASSDMIVIDLSENNDNLKVGDNIEFRMDYMGILRLLNSKYVDKRIIR